MRNCDGSDNLFRLPLIRNVIVNQCPIKYLSNYYTSIYKMIKTIFNGMGSGYTGREYLNELAIIIALKDIIFSAENEYDQNKIKKDK